MIYNDFLYYDVLYYDLQPIYNSILYRKLYLISLYAGHTALVIAITCRPWSAYHLVAIRLEQPGKFIHLFFAAPRYLSKKLFAPSRSFTYMATCSILINTTPHYLIR